MNNLNKEHGPKEELLRNLDWLYFNDINRFNFIEALMESVVNKMPVSISMSLNEDLHTISVKIGGYIYKEKFRTVERANNFIDMIRTINERCLV